MDENFQNRYGLYEGTKTLKAWPATRGEYNDYRGWDVPKNEDRGEAGYLVEYTDGGKPNHSAHDGYISWSPADVFEKTYRRTASVFITPMFDAPSRKSGHSVASSVGSYYHETPLPETDAPEKPEAGCAQSTTLGNSIDMEWVDRDRRANALRLAVETRLPKVHESTGDILARAVQFEDYLKNGIGPHTDGTQAYYPEGQTMRLDRETFGQRVFVAGLASADLSGNAKRSK